VPARPSGKGRFSEGKAFGSGEGEMESLNNTKNLVRTAKKTQHLKINWLTLFKKIIAVYGENFTKPINKAADWLL
jgi:hypothetical protein